MIDIKTARSPGWWLNRLLVRLEAKTAHFDMLESYYDGTAVPVLLTSKSMQEAYQRLMGMARTSWPELVVDAVRERMTFTGFRTGADSDDLGDREAWRMWQANSLDADQNLVHRDALVMGESYAIVGGPDRETGVPVITPEDPRQVITEHDPVRRRKVVAALKTFHDDIEEYDRVYLYLPGVVFKARRRHKTGIAYVTGPSGWEWDGPPNPLPFVEVPVVRCWLRDKAARGEFESHLPLLNRITGQVLHRMEIATLQAFRQRGIKGVPNVDENGVEIDYSDVFAADPGALWLLPETAEIWESGQVDLSPVRLAIRDDVQDLAAVSRTPLFYLTPEATNGSAEGASLSREGLIFKTRDRLVQAQEFWESVIHLVFLWLGDTVRASRLDMEALYAPPERYSLAERADAASKATAGGVPWRTIMTDIWQFSPQQVDRMETERVMDALLSPEQLDASTVASDDAGL